MKPWEVRESITCYELNQTSAKDLTDLLAMAQTGQLGLQIMQALTMLWVVSP